MSRFGQNPRPNICAVLTTDKGLELQFRHAAGVSTLRTILAVRID
jgi:hypothetical protein